MEAIIGGILNMKLLRIQSTLFLFYLKDILILEKRNYEIILNYFKLYRYLNEETVIYYLYISRRGFLFYFLFSFYIKVVLVLRKGL